MAAATTSEDAAGDPQSSSASRPRARAASQAVRISAAATTAIHSVIRLDTTTVSTSMISERLGSRTSDSMNATATATTSRTATTLSARISLVAAATRAGPPTMSDELAHAAAAATTAAASPTMKSRPVKMDVHLRR